MPARYVVDVDAGSAVVTIGTRRDLMREEVELRDVVLSGRRPDPSDPISVQTRAHGAPFTARLVGDRVRFDAPQARVAPGQLVALYDDDLVVGAGVAV